MLSALMTRIPETYSTMTEFMRESAAAARGMTSPITLKHAPMSATAAANGTSVASARGAFVEHRKTNAATGPARYMNASGMLWAKISSRRSTSSSSTVFTCPIDRSLSDPRGACARWSTMRHLASKSVR